MGWFDNFFSGGSLTSTTPSSANPNYLAGNVPVSAGGSGAHPGIESGYQPDYSVKNPFPTPLNDGTYDIHIGTSQGSSLGSGLDRDFMAAVAQQLGQIGQGRSGGGRRGGGGGGGRAGKFGASGIKPAQPVKAGLDVKGVAPNPGFYLNLPREQKYRYSGGL